ncbi:Alpha/Beta hydrolase protein [Penicillium hispanicum]|uniref:Alpha/Beta hydrolase protein n=1 Tax=Penicillium hispanicum TaxID=1080232 RepID=UPI0025412AD0|nr:Alpha/Beta hydrolase protein [Penicillium hispanicum]KAJ5594105.1 Alpha/Beta hydrolase protein [Penicillium hispanicum]
MASRFFQTSESSIHARISRPTTDSQKPLLVFLSYWGGTSSTWHKLTASDSPTSLSALYPTLAIDLRGWGQSTGPSEENGSAYSISAMANDVSSVLFQMKKAEDTRDLLEHGLVLVGHSMGAKVSLATLSTLSSDLLGLLKGLVLVAPAAPTTLDLPPDIKAHQQVAYESKESVRWNVENVLANTGRLHGSDIDQIIKDSLAGNHLAKKAWPSYGMREDVSQAVKKALASCRAGLRASVLVGEFDVVEPKEKVESQVVQFLAENGVDVSLKTVEGVKHLLPLEDPAAIYQEVCQF